MTGEEYKVWQPPERAAGTKKKKESLFFSFSKKWVLFGSTGTKVASAKK